MPTTRHFTPAAEWQDRRHVLGLWGERIAMAYLVSCGWNIEAHRFRLGRHDVDLVIRRGHLVAFVEVKTRGSSLQGTPAEAVGFRKQTLLAKVASLWCLRYGRQGDEYRFDLVAVHHLGHGKCRLEHVEDAWRLP